MALTWAQNGVPGSVRTGAAGRCIEELAPGVAPLSSENPSPSKATPPPRSRDSRSVVGVLSAIAPHP
jgi:hypothetical protein